MYSFATTKQNWLAETRANHEGQFHETGGLLIERILTYLGAYRACIRRPKFFSSKRTAWSTIDRKGCTCYANQMATSREKIDWARLHSYPESLEALDREISPSVQRELVRTLKTRAKATLPSSGKMETSASPGLAVSGLMQQLNSGEISKMQLFQQLAKLQAAPAAGSNGAPAPAPTRTSLPTNSSQMLSSTGYPSAYPTALVPAPAFSFSVAGSSSNASQFDAVQPPPAPAQFSYTKAVMPTTFSPQSMVASVVSPRALSMPLGPDHTIKPGATIVQTDAELLATGVSHDKAKRFSVQEWMANKSRASASSQVSNALRLHYQQQSQVQAAEFQGGNPSHDLFFDQHEEEFRDPVGVSSHENNTINPYPQQMGSLLSGTINAGAISIRERDDINRQSYVYSSLNNSSGQAQLVDEREHQYIDFTEQFRDELDDGHISTPGNNGGKVGGSGSNNNTDGKFHARVTRWKSQKDAIREQMKQQLLQSELDECTFAPKINPKSTKVVAKLRGRQSASISNQGLRVLQAVSERLYQEADNFRIREELASKLKAEEEAEIERQCTFKPKINQSDNVKAKYMSKASSSSPSMTAASREAAAKELAECTFYPKVNGIRSEMVSAQLYLQQNIYERLSKPCCGDSDDGKSPARGPSGRRRSLSLFGDDDDDDRDNLEASSPQSCQDDISVRPGGKNRRRRGQGPRSVDAEQSREGKEERARQFKNFLERQKFHEQARSKRIEMTKQQLTPGYRPTINKKSLAMMENGRKGDFLERISTYALRKEHDNVKKKTVRSSPAINQASTKRKPRSITELSRGDLLRRETTQRLMKLKMEQEEMAALTFRPQLNRMSERHEGRLKILSSPDTYLQRIQQQSQAHTIKQRRAIQEKELGEFAECTFKPRTIEAPAPDSDGETTLDAMILDGSTMEMGAVAQLRRVKPAIEVARAVMEHSSHSVLAGDGALAFAKMMGFEETPLDTPYSREVYRKWMDNQCQPNYFRNVVGQNTSCPPYEPLPSEHEVFAGIQGQSLLRAATSSKQNNVDVERLISKENHDTIGMVVLAENGHMAAGTSSNGATHKIAGRVGDAAVPGAGAYVDSSIGGAAATGDGDVMMRFLPSFFAVQEMKRGAHVRLVMMIAS
ncbi:unnamed protein product [Phytophthora fragariaefolia]|uniref:Unnamed protein product n=1 Tax=Phytophthora fragariaefolia TaxID=1490495 RepID=A0A9W6U7C0_9STRA|nr:unnamed protein product [Phytophthora fragariaefolia]